MLREIITDSNRSYEIGILGSPTSLENSIFPRKYNKNLTLYEYIWCRFHPKIFDYIDISKTYLNASCFKIKSLNDDRYNLLEDLIAGKELVVVTSLMGRIDINHGIFKKARNVKFILCPEIHSHLKVDEIYESCLNYDTNHLFLLSAGFLSKLLVYRLSSVGYWAIDIGAVPILYKVEHSG